MRFVQSCQRILTCCPSFALGAALAAPFALAAQDKESRQAARSGEALGVDLYRSLASGEGNIVFSPYSISEMLALLSEGAGGKTKQELLKALHWDSPPDRMAQAFGAQDQQLGRTDPGEGELLVSNGLWYQKGGEPRPGFLQVARGAYGAEVRSADFIGAAPAALAEINGWVDLKTRGKIADLLPPGSLEPSTRLALVNAVYFKGKWEHPFEARRTAIRSFFISPGSSPMVPLMNETETLKAVSIAGSDILELPYLGGALSMVILLPNSNDGLSSLERSLDANPSILLEWMASLDFAKQESIRVAIPRFKMTYSVELTQALRQSGVIAAFDPHEADFSEIDGARDLHVSTARHKAFIDVNEEGTEAAAATSVGMRTLGIIRAREFNADHPFLFLIRDNSNGSLLFLGRVVDPRGN
jgi:serpin B